MSKLWSVLELMEAFLLAHAVAVLHELNLFEALEKPRTAAELARNHDCDLSILRGTLEYVAARTELLRKSGQKFVVTRKYDPRARFLLDLYSGAYGHNASHLLELINDPASAADLVDRARHARAFAAVHGSPIAVLPDLIRQLGFNCLLDVGCGNGGLLLELAAGDPEFIGWGLEQNNAMCKLARARIGAAGVTERIKVIRGDCADLELSLPMKVKARVGAIRACNVVNEMFAGGPTRATTWLRNLRRVFPRRSLLLVDYYGRLGVKARPSESVTALRWTLLHDYAQLISGQGIPPSGLKEWRSIYRKAGCRLVHVLEDQDTTRFIHILRL